MLTGIVTSDWHLDGGLNRIFPINATEKQLYEVSKIAQYAVEHDIRNIFIPGDISDKARISEHTFISLVAFFLKFQSLEFYYTLGNHDVAQVGKTAIDVLQVFCQHAGLKNLHIYTKPELATIDGVQVGFIPYPYDKAPDSKKPTLLFAHAEEAGAIGDYGIPLRSAHMVVKRKTSDYVFSGHLHTMQILNRFAYCGSPFQKTFGENPDKGFLKFKAKYADGKLMVKPEFVNNRPSFRLINKLIEDAKDWEDIEVSDSLFYKLTLAEGVVAPKSITRDVPNIISINGTSFRGRDVLETSSRADTSSIPQYSITTGLLEYLDKFELKKSEKKIAVEMVMEGVKELQAQGILI